MGKHYMWRKSSLETWLFLAFEIMCGLLAALSGLNGGIIQAALFLVLMIIAAWLLLISGNIDSVYNLVIERR